MVDNGSALLDLNRGLHAMQITMEDDFGAWDGDKIRFYSLEDVVFCVDYVMSVRAMFYFSAKEIADDVFQLRASMPDIESWPKGLMRVW